MQKVIVILILFFSTFNLMGQHHYLLSNFNGFKDQNRVILNWTIKRGSSCIGIGILRSSDNSEYEVIGEIQGVCGSTEFAQAYNFIDENPVKNSKNYYKLELGFSGRTEPPVVLEYIDIRSEGYKMLPNPVLTNARLHFENTNNSKHFLSIYSSAGQFCGLNSTNENYFDVEKSKIDEANLGHKSQGNELYFFEIRDEIGNIKAKGKFMTID